MFLCTVAYQPRLGLCRPFRPNLHYPTCKREILSTSHTRWVVIDVLPRARTLFNNQLAIQITLAFERFDNRDDVSCRDIECVQRFVQIL